ncbi:MAG: hypothetical protein ACREUT_10995 [Steroidobacteraceae bacterium]
MAMLEGVADLTLETLNEATQAWVEYEYNRAIHSEIGESPLARFLAGPEVLRPSPDSAALRAAFTRSERRTQRASDGTVMIGAQRFEVPNRYRHLRELIVRYASWDLSMVHLVDERSGQLLCRLYPQDKTRNANAVRAPLEPLAASRPGSMPLPTTPATPPQPGEIAPLLAKLMRERAATGLPPAYLPKDELPPPDEGNDP